MSIYFVDVLETAIPMSLLIGLLLIISPLVKRSFVAKWRYFMWLFVAVRLIIPFHISVFKNPITMELPQQISGMPVMTETVKTATVAAPSLSLQSILMLIWLAGMTVFALYQIISYTTFCKSVKRWSKPVTDEGMIGIFNEIKSSLNEKRSLDFRICKSVSTPMVFGIIKPKLLLPDYKYTGSELAVILRHEMVHFKRNDIWYKLILVIANGINWFNPLVYVMVNAANKDIELACDAEVVKEHDMAYRRGYCEAILTVVHNKQTATTPLSTCFIISRKVIQERFKDILDLKKKRKGIGLFVIIALSVVISGGAVTFATEKAADVLEDELNIVERPTPVPRATEAPVETQLPEKTEMDYSGYYADTELPGETGTQNGGNYAAEPAVEQTIPQRREINEEDIVDVTKGSVAFRASFKDKGQSVESIHTFTSDTDATMAVYSSAGSIRVIDADTNEVVYDGSSAEERTARIPVRQGQRLNVSVTSTDDGESLANVYAYGYTEDADTETE